MSTASTGTGILGPATICRLDARLLERISRGERLGGVAISAVGTIVLGAGTYGIAFGIWRAFEQAAYSAVKLPTLLLLVAACTLALSVMLASVLRSKLSFSQTAVAILLSLAVTSAVLGAMAPISIVVALVAPPPDPAALGLAIDHPRVLPSLAVARTQVLLHVAVIACAGIVGVVRLRGLLGRLGLRLVVVRRVLVSFLSIQFLVGVELSWLLRPFFGRPHLPPTFSCDDLLKGNFFEELAAAMRPLFGDATLAVLTIVLGGVALAAVGVLWREPVTHTEIEIGGSGLAVRDANGERVVPWDQIVSVRRIGLDVLVELRPDETLAGDFVRAGCKDAESARVLAQRIEDARTSIQLGPFRTAGV